MLTGVGGLGKAQMSALEQTANSGQISDMSLQISEQMLNAFAALVRKHQVPGAQFAIYHGGLTVAHEIGELEFGTGLRVTRDAVLMRQAVPRADPFGLAGGRP
jgi:hypothetical protein